MNLSLLVADVDGTLVTSDKVLTPAAIAAVRRVREAGLKFTIVSSRPPRGMRMIVEALGVDGPFAGFNGGMIVKPDASLLTQHLLPEAVAARAVDHITACGAQAWVFTPDEWLVRDRAGPYVDHEERTVRFAPREVADFGPALGAAAKIVGVSADFALLGRCAEAAQPAFAGAAEVARSQLYYLDFTHPLANKGNALGEFAKFFGVAPGEIAAVGDGENDIAMFGRAGLRVAMGNALPHVQRAADFVAKGNNEDGFADAVERFILPALQSDRPPRESGGRRP